MLSGEPGAVNVAKPPAISVAKAPVPGRRRAAARALSLMSRASARSMRAASAVLAKSTRGPYFAQLVTSAPSGAMAFMWAAKIGR